MSDNSINPSAVTLLNEEQFYVDGVCFAMSSASFANGKVIFLKGNGPGSGLAVLTLRNEQGDLCKALISKKDADRLHTAFGIQFV